MARRSHVESLFDVPWHREGLCYGQGYEGWFFDDKHEASIQIPYAKEICATCPVQALCLESALINDERYGVWGGTSSIERKKMQALIERGLATVEDLVERHCGER